jgi:hypothetical protein
MLLLCMCPFTDGGAAELCWGHPSVGNTASLADTGGSSLQSLQSLQGSGSSAVEKALGAFSLAAPLGPVSFFVVWLLLLGRLLPL